jgi:Coenzyme PQQ synthesis protein D (PqqD)
MATALERPRARTEGLVIKALPAEVLVHDLARHRTHCLNHAAAAVWRLCDGQRTPADIARTLAPVPDGRWSDEAVRLALDELRRAHLLTDVLTGRIEMGGVTRRQTLQRLAAAAVVVPTVATIVAPRAAQAQSVSCIPENAPCVPIQFLLCCSQRCGGCTGAERCCPATTPCICAP